MITTLESRKIRRYFMAETADGIHDPYLATLNMKTSEHLKLYNKAIIGLSQSDRYDLTRSKWTYFYQ